MENFVIDMMQISEVPEVAEILTDSFLTNPAYSLIFKKEDERQEGLYRLFRMSLLMQNSKQMLTRVIKEKDTGRIVGAFSIVPPEGVKNGFSVYFKAGLFSFIAKYGFTILFRILGMDGVNKRVLIDSMHTSRFYYLSMVVIRKEYRGKGVGGRALKQAIDELISSAPACRLMGLTTQLPENVTFYSRLGFEKVGEGEVYFKNDHYYNYNMRLRW